MSERECTFKWTINADADLIEALKKMEEELAFYRFMEEMTLYYEFLDLMKNNNMIWT